mmetsp:Transcript_28862/g.46712  ORF Transcript_28862/g.46712 Transcript_28862/m.46712 type:complete len:185 (+) Transcript_28862:623-1177(+)
MEICTNIGSNDITDYIRRHPFPLDPIRNPPPPRPPTPPLVLSPNPIHEPSAAPLSMLSNSHCAPVLAHMLSTSLSDATSESFSVPLASSKVVPVPLQQTGLSPHTIVVPSTPESHLAPLVAHVPSTTSSDTASARPPPPPPAPLGLSKSARKRHRQKARKKDLKNSVKSSEVLEVQRASNAKLG